MNVYAGLLADSFVSLAAFFGLIIFMSLAARRRAGDPLARRILFGMGALAVMLLSRVLFWLTSIPVFQTLTLIAAALVPLAALVLTEGLLRRHAPAWLKAVAAGGAAASSLFALFPSSVVDPARLWTLFAFQFFVFMSVGWLVVTRDRASLSAAENKTVERLALSLLLIIPSLITDYRFGSIELPVRLGGIAILCLSWLGIGLSRSNVNHRDTIKTFVVLATSAIVAGLVIAKIGDFDWQGAMRCAAITLSASILAAIYNDSKILDADERRESLMRHLAEGDTSSSMQFLKGLRSYSLLEGAIILAPEDLGDFDLALLRKAFAEHPVRESARYVTKSESNDATEQLSWLFEKFESTHVLLVSEQPFTLLALAIPQITSLPGAMTELKIAQRMALLISRQEKNS